MADTTSNTAPSANSTLGKILFPPLPGSELIQRTLRSFFANTKSQSPVHAVLDERGVIRFWSVSKGSARGWGHRHLWDPFKVVELNAELGQFAVRS